MKINHAKVVKRFSKDLILRTFQPGGYSSVDGTWISGLPNPDQDIRGVSQPATAEDLLILPEAERRKQIRAYWTTTRLKINSDDISTASDIIIENGRQFKVIHLFDRSDNKFYKCLAEFLPND